MVGRIRRKRSSSVQDLLECLEARCLLSASPNDPYYAQQYSLKTSNASAAWAVSTGLAAVKVGVIDTGMDYTHPDLYLNVWINPSEIPPAIKPQLQDTDGDGLITFYDLNNSANAGLTHDLNHNGYIDAGDLLQPISAGGWDDGVNGETYAGDTHVDDIVGWDFANNDNNPLDTDGHGSHVAGIIGARGDNGVGTAGVTWKVSMMAIRIFSDSGASASEGRIAQAIHYAVDAGAAVMNASWGSTYASSTIENAIGYANQKGRLFVTSAGNNSASNDLSWQANYPAAFGEENVIAVAATTSDGTRASYSNFGRTTVDVAAPGDDIISTYKDGGYEYLSGTSMASPFVTGTVALMLSVDPNLTASEIRTRLIESAAPSTSLYNTNQSHGRVDVGAAVAGLVPAPPSDSRSVSSGAGTVSQPELPWASEYWRGTPGFSTIPTPISSYTFGASTAWTSGASDRTNTGSWLSIAPTASAVVDSAVDELKRSLVIL